MSAPFQLVPTSGSFLPMHPRVSGAIREWPAPEAVALRRSNEWPAPSLDTMAWADDAFEMRAVTLAAPPLLRLPAPTERPVALAVPFAAPSTLAAPTPFDAPALLAAPAAMPAPLAMPTAMLAPPAPATLTPPDMASAPALLPPPSSTLAPPTTELTVLPAPVTEPGDADHDGEPSAPTRTRRPIVRLQDAIITLSVAAATALITLVLLSQL